MIVITSEEKIDTYKNECFIEHFSTIKPRLLDRYTWSYINENVEIEHIKGKTIYFFGGEKLVIGVSKNAPITKMIFDNYMDVINDRDLSKSESFKFINKYNIIKSHFDKYKKRINNMKFSERLKFLFTGNINDKIL